MPEIFRWILTCQITSIGWKWVPVVLLFGSFHLGWVGAVGAHAVSLDARLKEGNVFVEAYFDDDAPARDAKVRVENEAKETIAEGRTDREGNWIFPMHAPGKYRVFLDAGDGHRANVSLRIPSPGEVEAVPASVPHNATRSNSTKERENRVSDGPSRKDFTSVPIIPLAVGLALLAIVGIVWPKWRRTRPSQP